MKILFTGLIVIIAAAGHAPAQTAKVGDEVRYQCFCFGQEWVKASVEAAGGGSVRVRFGNMDNQVVTLPVNSPKLRWPGANSGEFRADAMQQAFASKAAPKYRRIVEQFAHFYDSKYNSAGDRSGRKNGSLRRTSSRSSIPIAGLATAA
jgi:hypothetical protein